MFDLYFLICTAYLIYLYNCSLSYRIFFNDFSVHILKNYFRSNSIIISLRKYIVKAESIDKDSMKRYTKNNNADRNQQNMDIEAFGRRWVTTRSAINKILTTIIEKKLRLWSQTSQPMISPGSCPKKSIRIRKDYTASYCSSNRVWMRLFRRTHDWKRKLPSWRKRRIRWVSSLTRRT